MIWSAYDDRPLWRATPLAHTFTWLCLIGDKPQKTERSWDVDEALVGAAQANDDSTKADDCSNNKERPAQ